MSAPIELSPLLPADAAAIVAGSDAEITRWLGVTNTDVQETAAALRAAHPAVTNLGIRVDGRLVGIIGCQTDQPGMVAAV